MEPAYIPVLRHWNLYDDLRAPAEIRVESKPDEDHYTDAQATSIQAFAVDNGDPIGGQIVLNPNQVAKLVEALRTRLVELGHESTIDGP